MKKLFVLSLLAAGMTFVSCGADDPESKAQQFVEDFLDAEADDDREKMKQLDEEIKEYKKTLSKEERDLFNDIIHKGLFDD